MTTYIVRRIVQTLITIALLSFFCYFILTLMPGDPVEMMASSNPNITTEDIERLRALYDLDKPVWYRYSNWMKDILSGNLGYSRTYKVPVQQILIPRIINTAFLALGAIVLSVLIGVFLGILAAIKKGTKTDYIVNFGAFALFSIPAFWLAIILIILFAVWIPIFPAGGTYTVGAENPGLFAMILDRLKYIALPLASLTCIQLGSFARYSRSSMLESMSADYIRTAKAKGLNKMTVIMRHGFRNALIPIITVVAISFGFVFSGAILTETVFSYQGVGRLLYESIISNDFNVAMICLMISVAMVLFMSMVADILYGVVDPRISYS